MTLQEKVMVEVEFTREELVEGVARQMYTQLSRNGDAIELQIRNGIRALVVSKAKSVIDEMTEAAIRYEVGKLLAEGWAVTDQWGGNEKKKTVKDMVLEHLTSKKDPYKSDTLLDTIAKDMISECLETELRAEIDALRARIKKALVDQVDGGIRRAFLDALGLKA